LFGGTNVESGSEKIGNIRHRIEYGTAFSLQPFKDIGSATTFNGVIDATQSTGQALGTRYAVIPASVFPSIVTLRSVTWREVVLTIKTLLACKSYGAESRIGGDARNTIVGIAAGWEEVVTPLELTLELYDRCVDSETPAEMNADTARRVLDVYAQYAGNKDKVKVFGSDEVVKIVDDAASTALDKAFLDAAYADVAAYREVQKQAGKKK
jgi:CRISPR type I-D-associated protein Csc2